MTRKRVSAIRTISPRGLRLPKSSREIFVPMTQIERAQLLHTLGLAAVKQGDVSIGKGLLREAIDTHPQHFEAAVRSLRALENNVTN